MRRLSRYYLLCLAAVVLMPVDGLFAGAHVREPCDAFISVEGYSYQTARQWNRARDKVKANNKFEKWEVSVYGEFGWDECNTILGQIRFADVKDTANGSASGIDEAYVGYKRQLLNWCGHVFSWQSQLIIPGGRSDKHIGLRYGRWGTQSQLMYSKGFDWWCGRGFLDLSGGYRAYFGYPADQIVAESRLGLDLPWCFQIIGWLQLDYGLNNGTEKRGGGSPFGNANYRLLKGALMGRYKVNDCISVLAGWQQHLWGQTVGTGGGWYGAAWIEF